MSSVAGPTIDEVRRVADELGYVPSQVASGLATGRQRAVGVVLPVIERWFYVRALAGELHLRPTKTLRRDMAPV